MAREIREGLMAAATGLIEGFGTTMMRNVEQRDKEEREFVRSQASLMRERIAKGRAKQSKLENEVRSRLTTIETTTPGLLDSDKIAYASDGGSFNAYQNAVAKDKQLIAQSPGKKIEDIGGTWYNQKDEAGKRINPYVRKSAEATAMATLMEGVFPKVSIAPTPEKEEETTSELLNRIFGGDTDPNKLLDIAERKVVSQRGIGKVQNLDLYYARGGQAIQPSAKVGTPIGPVTAKQADLNYEISGTTQDRVTRIITELGRGLVGPTEDKVSMQLNRIYQRGRKDREQRDGIKIETSPFKNSEELSDLSLTISKILTLRRKSDKRAQKEVKKLINSLAPSQKVVLDLVQTVGPEYIKSGKDLADRVQFAQLLSIY
tara:strand:+ start:1536 stop:2657 length:1122 start_codon:yes stop_codon:yes gene_type:complete